MAIGTGPLLRSGNRKDYKALGEEGNPVYKWATQIRVAIKRNIGADSTRVFAVPQVNEDGDILDWYAPESGPVVPWTSATRDERISAKEQLAEIKRQLSAAEHKLNTTENKEQSVFKRLLVHVIQFPDDQHVYLVNGKPVLTFWGFVDADSAPRSDPLALLTIPALSAAADEIPYHEYVVEEPPVRRGFSWWWLLAIPLLLLLLLFLLRGCDQLQQYPVLKNIANLDLDRISVDTSDTDSTVDYSTNVTGSVGIDDDVSYSESTVFPDDPANIAPQLVPGEVPQQTPEQAENALDGQQPEDALGEQQPESDPEKSINDTEETPTPSQLDPDAENTPQQPLAIPPDASQQKSLDFLDGRWQANTGLMDEHGRPVNLEYDFKDGKGSVRIKKNDGSVCTGAVEASMNDAGLSFSDKGNIKCPDGKFFKPAKVTCKTNAANQTVCEGAYKNGNNFKMDITKSASTQNN